MRIYSEIWAVGIIGHLCLLTGLTQGKGKLSCAFMMKGSITLGARCSRREVRLLSSHRDWKVVTLSSSIMSFQRDGPRSLRKTVLGCRTGKRLLKIFAFQRGKERFYNYIFSKVNALRKGSRGTSVVRPSGFYKGLGERAVRGLEAGRSLLKCS